MSLIKFAGPVMRRGSVLYKARIDVNPYADAALLDIMAHWCADHFGITGPWFDEGKDFYFYRERDLTLFTLRWS